MLVPLYTKCEHLVKIVLCVQNNLLHIRIYMPCVYQLVLLYTTITWSSTFCLEVVQVIIPIASYMKYVSIGFHLHTYFT